MSYLDGVPFRMSSDFANDSAREENFVCAPEFEMSSCAEILISTVPDFSLEKKVLCWIESASWQDTPWYEVTTGIFPTAPPCWLLRVDSKDSDHERAGGRIPVESPARGCVSPGGESEDEPAARGDSDQYSAENKDSEGEGSSSATPAESDQEEHTVSNAKGIPGRLPSFLRLPQPKPKTSPVQLVPSSVGNLPRPPLVKQKRSMISFVNVKNELGRAKGKLAAFLRSLSHSSTESILVPRAFSLPRPPQNNRNLRCRSASDVSPVGTQMPALPSTPPLTRPLPAAHSSPPVKRHKPTLASLSPPSCLPPLPGALQSPGSHGTSPDSTADLLSALSQEERDLIEPVLALGYPIRRAILALQKTGRQSLGQFLSYLSACDKLLKQGFEEAQVEEAMEMFQNPEKAAEFLHLLAQFNDMGFQQADIKEVLLLCENQRENALEELMSRAQ